MALTNSEISDKIEQFVADCDTMHLFVQGGKTVMVSVGGVQTPTLSYFSEKLNGIENEATESAEAASLSEANAKTSETNASKSEASAKTSETNAKTSETNAASSADSADASKIAAQTVATAAAEAVSAATAQANAAHDSALAAAQSAIDAAAAVPENLVARVTDVEGVAASAKAVTDLATETPGAGKIPKAGPNGKIDPRWYGTPSRLFASFNTSEPDGLLCNGGAYSRTTYAALFAILGTSFGAGDGSTTFNVPNFRGRTIQGANANLKAILSAGLPDIIGDASRDTGVGFIDSTGTGVSGAFVVGARSFSIWCTSSSQSAKSIGFRAGAYNSIYGAATTVQPPAIAANIFIKY